MNENKENESSQTHWTPWELLSDEEKQRWLVAEEVKIDQSSRQMARKAITRQGQWDDLHPYTQKWDEETWRIYFKGYEHYGSYLENIYYGDQPRPDGISEIDILVADKQA